MNGTLAQAMIPLMALIPAAQGTTAVNGPTLVRPWEKGRKLLLLALGGALVAADDYTILLEARRVGTSTWDSLLETDGTTPLGFTATDMVDAGALENGVLLGSLDLTRLSMPSATYEYDAIRVVGDNANNTTPGIIAVVALICDLYTLPYASADDDLLYKTIVPA